VRYATLRARKSELFHRYEAYGEPDAEIEMAYYFWLLRCGERTVLVDTGFDPEVGARRGRTCLVEPLQALQRLGVSPGSVSAVVVTHFHYDHIGNVGRFPAAELIVPRRELEFWSGPLARGPKFAAHVESAELKRIGLASEEGRVRATEGGEILPGVTALHAGGHSPGQQLTIVATESGRVVLTSDAVHFYEEIELNRPFAIFADLGAMHSGYDRVAELARVPGTAVVAGHDPSVMERFAAPGASADLAVRVSGNSAATAN
jgi:glyoxylase-like metal-dependent hydrolase (beta-lactamase superfamily II)